MPLRLLALILLLAVLPTVEVAEQLEHVVAHALDGDVSDHPAHHEQDADEHGCTGLIHLCGCHQAQVTAAATVAQPTKFVAARSQLSERPSCLTDLNSLEPPHRPPIETRALA